jgi:hypothetical protein
MWAGRVPPCAPLTGSGLPALPVFGHWFVIWIIPDFLWKSLIKVRLSDFISPRVNKDTLKNPF